MTRVNPYLKYMGPEDHLQHQVIVWMAFQYPDVKFHHSPNEGKRSPFEQFKFKYLGSDDGFPDLFFPSIFLVIELKVKPNKPTAPQLQWLQFFREHKYLAEVCYTYEEATKVITDRINFLKQNQFI